MRKFKAALVGVLCLVAIVGCTTNTNPGNVLFTTNAKLQLAVGIINDPAGTLAAQTGSVTGGPLFLDAISTFRNQFGNSAFLQPGLATLTPGSGTGNIGTAGFGGLFAYGQIARFNSLPAAGPAWAAPGSDTGYLIDINGGGSPGDIPNPSLGEPLTGGTAYSLTDSVVVNGQTQTYTAGATLNAVPTVLGVGSATYAPNAGTGGGTFNFGAYPAGATEQVAVVLSALPGNVLAMVKVNTPTLSGTLPAGTLAAGAYTCFVMAADFPWVEAGVVNAPAVGTQTPTIVGANGNADLSASATFTCTQT